MTDRRHYSPSQVNTLCMEAYRRRYIEGERIAPAVRMIRGRAIHQSAQANFEQKRETHVDIPIEDFQDVCASAFDNETSAGYSLEPDEASIGAKKVLGAAKDMSVSLAEFHGQIQAPDYQPTLVEQKFRLCLPDYDFVGVIDVVDDQRRVIDFKTAAKKKNQNDADTSIQLTAYGLGHQALTGKPVSHVLLDVAVQTDAGNRSRQILNTTRDDSDVEALAARIDALHRAVTLGVFMPAPPGSWFCSPRWCGFHSTCPFVGNGKKGQGD